jgi:hypothetical protein
MVRLVQLYRFFTLCSGIILIAGSIGAMAAIFPPMAAFGVVGLMGALLIWAFPETRHVPEKGLRKAFLVMVVVQLCVPAYYTIQVSSLPWISVRRIFAFITIILFAIVIAGSKSARAKIYTTLADNKNMLICAIGFLIMVFLSVFTSANASISLSQTAEIILNWYVPFFSCLLVVKTDKDVLYVLKLIVYCSFVVGLIGVCEFMVQHRFVFDLFPKSMLAKMMEDNPAIAILVNYNPFRNGLYRASSIFTIPLSFGEFEAMTAPICIYFILHGTGVRDWLLGSATFGAVVVSIFCSGARGAYISFFVAMPVLAILWIIRYTKANPLSLAGAISSFLTMIGTGAVVALVFFWRRLYNVVIGGDALSQASANARLIQWELAKPHILVNPITGNGVGMGAEVVGYYTASPIPTVDSYIITLLVETGIPGCLFFFGMIACAIWLGVHIYLSDPDQRAAPAGPLACSILAFAIYRTVLSQRENQTLFFIVMGLMFVLQRLARERQPEAALEAKSAKHCAHTSDCRIRARRSKTAPSY